MADLTNTEITKKICAIEGFKIDNSRNHFSSDNLKDGYVYIENPLNKNLTVAYSPYKDSTNVRLRDKYKVTVDYAGYSVLIVENDIDCWVLVSYKEIGINKAVLLAIIEAYDNRS